MLRQVEVEEGRMIMKTGSRLEACTMLRLGVVVGRVAAIARSWRRMRRGRVTSTTILGAVIPEAVGDLPVVCRADRGEVAYLVVRGWDGDEI